MNKEVLKNEGESVDKTVGVKNQNQSLNESVDKTVGVKDSKDEFKHITTKEELDLLLKAESNRAKTQQLKELGVNSVKEFKALQEAVEKGKSEIDSVYQELSDYRNKYTALESELETLSQERTLHKFQVKEEYREDIKILALNTVDDNVTFEDAIKDLVSNRYKYVTQSSNTDIFKLGVEKTNTEPHNAVDDYIKNNPTVKAYKEYKERNKII